MNFFHSANRDTHAVLAIRPSISRTSHGPVEYTSTGEGPAVLTLHGGMGGYDQGLILARAALNDTGHFHVISVSRPGYLNTPLRSGETPEEQADMFAYLLDRLGVERSFVIAVSAGGPSALQFARRYPARCAGVILVSCCTGHLDIPRQVASRIPVMKLLVRFPWLAALVRWRARRDPERSAIRAIADEAVRTRTLGHHEAGPLMRELQSSTMSKLARRLPGTLNDMEQFSAISRLPLDRINAPILVIHGTADRVVPFAHAKRVADEAPNAELFAIEGGEHVSIFTHIDEIRARIGAFFEAILAKPASP